MTDTISLTEWACDHCAAKAVITATSPKGSELQLCGHHARTMTDALTLQGFILTRKTGLENEESMSGVAIAPEMIHPG